MELDRWAMVPELVGAWASAGREVSLHLDVEDSTVSAEAGSPGVVAVAAPGEEVVAGDMAILDMPRLLPQLMPTRDTPQLIPLATVTHP